MEFQATVELGGKTAAGIAVPDAVIAALSESRRPAVTNTVRGYSYCTTVARVGAATWFR